MSSKPVALGLLRAALLLAAPLAAQPGVSTPKDNTPAIGGYSPVSYFTVGRPQKGSPSYTSIYNSKVYWLTSAEQVKRFEADPGTYAPVFPDHCPYSLSLGRAVAIDPTNFLIMGDNLLLFHDSAEMDTIAQALEAEGANKMLERARGNLIRLQF